MLLLVVTVLMGSTQRSRMALVMVLALVQFQELSTWYKSGVLPSPEASTRTPALSLVQPEARGACTKPGGAMGVLQGPHRDGNGVFSPPKGRRVLQRFAFVWQFFFKQGMV